MTASYFATVLLNALYEQFPYQILLNEEKSALNQVFAHFLIISVEFNMLYWNIKSCD